MRIRINIQIFLVAVLLTFAHQIKVYAWLMLFALIHECAHMITGLLLNLKPKSLEIEPFGVSVIFEGYKNSEIKKIIIAIAGPVMNFILAGSFSLIDLEAKTIIINSNLLLGLFNLVPIYPLDGGRILKYVLKVKNDGFEIETIINKTSNILMIILTILSSVLILIYKNIGLFIIVIYLWLIIIKENKKYELKKKINNLIEKENIS